MPVTIASDGFGFYIPPLLAAAGLADIPVVTNTWSPSTHGGVQFGNGHPECIGCGTCKMLAALGLRERFGPVAFVGEGQSDRYGALYSDVVFAKDALVTICEADGVPYLPWSTFEDVRDSLESLDALPGAVAPERCPGWRTA